MKKPLFAEILEAEEYQYLYTDNDNMNYYSAKFNDNEYVVVDEETSCDAVKRHNTHRNACFCCHCQIAGMVD